MGALRILTTKKGYLQTDKKAKGPIFLMCDGKSLWVQVEDAKSKSETPEVLNRMDVGEVKNVYALKVMPYFAGTNLIEIHFQDGLANQVGPVSEAETQQLKDILGNPPALIDFRQFATTPSEGTKNLPFQHQQWVGYVRFSLTQDSLLVSFDDEGDVAAAGFGVPVNGRTAKVVPLEGTMTFELDDFTGSITTETKKEIRGGATAALFPIIGLGTILVPRKKVELTTDSRTFEVKMGGNGWQIMFVFPAAFFNHVQELRSAIQKEVVKSTPPEELERLNKPAEPARQSNSSVVEELGNAAKLLEAGLITREEFDDLKAKLMN